MRESKAKVIGKYEYTVTQLPATEARHVFTMLARVFGSAAGSAEPIAALMAEIKDDNLDVLCKKFSSQTFVAINSKQSPLLADVFDEHFAGDIGGMFKWLAFCLEVNFGNFFAELGLDLAKLGPRLKASVSASPTTVTGPSGV